MSEIMNNSQLFKFEKNNPHTHFFLFVAKALMKVDRKSSYREHLSMIYCDGARVIATDGHRLHIYTPEECPIPSGLFSVEKKGKSLIYISNNYYNDSLVSNYPEFARIIPKKFYNKNFSTSSPAGKLANVLRDMGDGCLNIGFFTDAVSIPEITEYTVEDSLSPVALTGNSVMAIVMPMRNN